MVDTQQALDKSKHVESSLLQSLDMLKLENESLKSQVADMKDEALRLSDVNRSLSEVAQQRVCSYRSVHE